MVVRALLIFPFLLLSDGTTNFVHRLRLTCVLIGFLVNRQPVVGVIYDPMAGEMFYAVQGQGAWLQQQQPNDDDDDVKNIPAQRLHVSSTTEIPQAVVAMDAGYGRHEAAVDNYLRMQRAILLQRVRHVRVLGCCGLTMAYVAAGRLDAALEQGSWSQNTGPKIWDFSAGKLLVQEAGGVTRDLTSPDTQKEPLNLLERSLFCAATDELANKLMETVHSS